MGAAAYAETVLAARDLVAAAPPADPARLAIGERLLALGLPDAALAAVAPAAAAGDAAAQLIAARAELGRGDAEAARLALGALAGPQAAELRARAFALSGAYGQALATLADSGIARGGRPLCLALRRLVERARRRRGAIRRAWRWRAT